jgi:transcriptional regulator with XRE-family HTH domain
MRIHMSQMRTVVFRATQEEMAAIAGTTQATWSRWEHDIHRPSLDDLARIREEARRRGLDWDDAFFFDGDPTAPSASETSLIGGDA